MRTQLSALLLGSACSAALAAPALAQSTDTPDTAAAAVAANDLAETRDSAEIIVTARRRAESLQDVPQTVNAVTSEEIEKLNLQNFQDISSVVPGLVLESAGNGFSNTASIRGVSFDVTTGAKPTVGMYINEVPIEANILFSGMFDVGQIEVLRGPQGTVRGRSAPSGAITVTTRRPDLNEIGGTANVTVNTRGDVNGQAAVGLPIIPGVLSVRLAGLIDRTDAGGVQSVNSTAEPYQHTDAGRATLRFEPGDQFSVVLMYQYMHRTNASFTQVFGNGAPGGTVPGYTALGGFVSYPSRPAPPAGYSGPVISPFDRLAVGEDLRVVDQKFQIFTANVDWEFWGQKLSYVGGWTKQDTLVSGGGDPLNSYPGGVAQTLDNHNRWMSHELRLSSVERVAGIFDYTIGAFLFREKNDVDTRQRSIQPGAFGPLPAAGLPQTLQVPNPTYIGTTYIRRTGDLKEDSFFATLTAHLGDRTEVTGGIRHITWKEIPGRPIYIDSVTTPPASITGLGSTICLGAVPILHSSGFFNITQPALCIANAANPNDTVDKAWVWNISASHKFSDDFMLYGTVGTSWRPGPFSVAPFDLEAPNQPAPGLASSNDLRFHKPERTRSYEIGFKSTFLDRRARLNVALYYQTFKDYFFFSNNTYRLNISSSTGTAASTVGTFDFTANADAVVKGIDVDAAFQITPRWSISGAFSYADGKIDNDEIPCNDGNFDGEPDDIVPTAAGFVAAGVIVARCNSNTSVSRNPKWNLSLQSEFNHPVSSSVNAFVRGQFTYYPSNPFRSNNYVVGAYGLLNMWAGLRSADGMWEANVFARNILNQKTITEVNFTTIGNQFFGNPGYNTLNVTPRREVGFNLRYSFGSR